VARGDGSARLHALQPADRTRTAAKLTPGASPDATLRIASDRREPETDSPELLHHADVTHAGLRPRGPVVNAR
jgi:hypothetical protein